MKKSRILIALGAAGLAAGASAAAQDSAAGAFKTLDGGPPVVIAHRGASGHLPEHTIAAYDLAIELGADFIEPDLVVTKDGVLVARHDRYLGTTTDVAAHPEFADRKRKSENPEDEGHGPDWWVEDFTLDELKTLRAVQPRAGRDAAFDGRYEIPTFVEVLTLAARRADERGRPIGVYPETKHPGWFAEIGLDFEAPLKAALEGFDAGPVYVQSFEPEILKRLQGSLDATLVQLVYPEGYAVGGEPNIALEDLKDWADAVGPWKGLLLDLAGAPTGFVAEAHRLGLAVHPWTFRDDDPPPGGDAPRAEIARYFDLGVDGVFTDFPDTAVSARAVYARRHAE